VRVFYSPDYVAAKHEFDTTRKAAWVANLIANDVDLTAPDTTNVEALIRRVHDNRYIDALSTGQPKRLAESQGFDWDAGLWRGILASTAGMVSAVDETLIYDRPSGSLSSGMHHAGYDYGTGFCSVNGLVVAAKHAIEHYGVRVTILDLDAHAGGGTDNLLRKHEMDDVQHLDLTVSPFDTYRGVRHRTDRNFVMEEVDDWTYLVLVEHLLEQIPLRDDRLVIYNAGMDAYPMVSRDALAKRELMVADYLHRNRLNVVFGLAGGYTWNQTAEESARMHVHTVNALAGIPAPSIAS
jgi:acetoin utilization deacetylase AcuC-like enzyme